MQAATGRRAPLAPVAAAALAAVVAGVALAGGVARAAESPLTARVDRMELSLGEVVTLEVRLEAAAPPSSWDFPDMPDFETVATFEFQGPSETDLGGGGGVRIREVHSVIHALRPTRAGALTIPSIAAVVQGKRYVTQPIVVKVTAGGKRAPGASAAGPNAGTPGAAGPGRGPATPPQAGPRGRWAYNGWERDVSLRMEVSKREAWVGEQLTADAWLLGPYEMGFEADALPSYDGFWKERIDDPRRPHAEVRGDLRAYLLTRFALFPTRTGELTIDPLTGKVQVALRGNAFDPSGEIAQVAKRTAPVAVRVKPLPPDAPPGFAPTNVGSLLLTAAASPERVAAGEPVTLRITISGDGNVRALVPPRLPSLEGARAYPPTTSDRAEVRDGRLVGTRTIETVIVPDRTGVLTLPALEWPYFDPRLGKYQVAITPALRIDVDPAGTPHRSGGDGADAAGAPSGSSVGANLRPIRAEGALRRAGPPPWRRPWFLALLLAPPLAFASVAAAARLRAGSAGARAIGAAEREARRRLGNARRRRARDPRGAAAEVERALLGYAGARLRRPAGGLRREELAAELARAGAHAPAVRALLQALERVDAARYGAGDVHSEELLTAAERALDALDEADWQPAQGVGA